ncbi:hypothetical protein ACM66B_006718 [Microbotryomycetes sp. NB124-2]
MSHGGGHVRRRSSVASKSSPFPDAFGSSGSASWTRDERVTITSNDSRGDTPAGSTPSSPRVHRPSASNGTSSERTRSSTWSPSPSDNNKRTSLMLHAAGLVVIYSLYGVLQEKIMRSSTYGPNNEHFTSSSLLIVVNRLFSITTGCAILWYKSSKSPEHGSFGARLRPASPYVAYASVAFFNFLSTTCQYEALKYVSYTTQSLAKTSKMIPVLAVGAVVWKKQHKPKEWIAGAVILLGCATYLFSAPPAGHKPHQDATQSSGFLNGLLGALFLVGYLFFDGLVSTTQEKVFGKNPSSSDPFGPESPVLDQMVWTNCFACAIAVTAALVSNATGTLLPNLRLLMTSASLLWDVVVFSGASAVGLIILLNTIASFGALTSSLIMTIRQFLSILINAGIFGNFSSVSLEGWCGVGWVASGIWIKINKKYDPPKVSRAANSGDEHRQEELEVLVEKDAASARALAIDPTRTKRYIWQYAVPVLVPVALAILVAMFAVPSGNFASTGAVGAAAERLEHLAVLSGWRGTEQDAQDETALASADAAEALNLYGGKWDAALHSALTPECNRDFETRPYNGSTKTGFVSFPRSGNSYMRSLVERATSYQTSSVYCDLGLAKTFLGECDHDATFFIKTHFPALPRVYTSARAGYYKQYDQVVHLIRNPLDSIASWYHLSHAPKSAEGNFDHEAKVTLPGGKFSRLQRDSLVDMAERWGRHALYWSQAPVLTHTLRYEDLKATPIPKMISLLAFLLPEEDLPPLSDLACIVERKDTHQPYKSRRRSDFASWDDWEPDIRAEVLKIVRRPFCAAGYLATLRNARGGELPTEMEGFCDSVDFSSKVDIPDVTRKPNGDMWSRFG